jgi:hypothetical protein
MEKSEMPVRTKWEFAGDEDALAKMYGKNDELQSEVNGEKQ